MLHHHVTLGTPMGIITVDAAPDLARRYVLASRPKADVAPGVRRPADMVPVRKADGDPKNAAACPTRSAPTTAQNERTMVVLAGGDVSNSRGMGGGYMLQKESKQAVCGGASQKSAHVWSGFGNEEV